MVVLKPIPTRFGGRTNATVLLLVLLVLLSQTPVHAATSAWVSYQVCCEGNSTGIYEYKEHVFFVAEVGISSKNRKDIHWQGKAMLEVGRLVQEYLVRGVANIAAKDIPFHRQIREQSEQLLGDYGHASNAVRNLPTRILVNKAVERVYRYVAAARKADLEQQKGSITITWR